MTSTPAESRPTESRPAGRRTRVAAASGIAIALLACGAVLTAQAHKDVRIDLDGQILEVGTFAGSVESLLIDQEVAVAPHDLVVPDPATPLRDGDTVVVRSAVEIEVEIDGETTAVWTTARTAGEALAVVADSGRDVTVTASRSSGGTRQPLDLPLAVNQAAHIVIDGERRVVEIVGEADLEDVLEQAQVRVGKLDEVEVGSTGSGLAEIRITRVSTGMETQSEPVSHESVEQQDGSLYVGERRVVQEGVDGERIRAVPLRIVAGEVERGGPSDYVVVTEPVTEIVAVGTRQRPAPAPVSSSGGSSSGSSGSSSGSSSSGSSGGSSTAASGDVWAQLAQCESGGNPSVVSSNGLYYGLYQFSLSTWQSVGGSGLPSEASAAEQLERAQALQARSGWGQWPSCARRLGLL